jgi:hypothetical protein
MLLCSFLLPCFRSCFCFFFNLPHFLENIPYYGSYINPSRAGRHLDGFCFAPLEMAHSEYCILLHTYTSAQFPEVELLVKVERNVLNVNRLPHYLPEKLFQDSGVLSSQSNLQYKA